VIAGTLLKSLQRLRKLFSLVSRGLSLKLAGLWALTILASTLEVVGVSVVFPLFQILLDRDRLVQQAWFQKWFGGIAVDTLLLGVCAAILVLFVLKSVVLMCMGWLKLRLQALLFQNLSGVLFKVYLQQPISFHVRHRATELIRNITSYVTQTSQAGFLGVVDFFSDIIICAGIFAVLAFVQPTISVIALLVISVVAAAYVRIGQPYFIRWGRAYNVASAMLTQTSMDALVGIKTIKVAGCENYFLQEFRRHAAEYSNLSARNNFAGSVPRQVLELMAVIAIVGTITWAVLGGQNLGTLISMLALFAAAIYRMMPSVVRIATTLQNFRVAQDAISVVYAELLEGDSRRDIVQGRGAQSRLKQGIVFENVSFTYPGTTRRTLDKINLDIRRGDVVAFVGMSGAGKTTLADVLLGLHEIDSGSITIDGVSYAKVESIPKDLFGYVPQDPFMVDDSIRRNIALGVPVDDIDDERLAEALKVASLDTFVASLPRKLGTVVGDRGVRISGGQRQRIGVARAIYANRDVLVLDEATSAVDMATEAEISDAINKLRGSKTMVVIAHRLSTVRHCDRLFFMKEGAIVDSGTFDELMVRNSEFAAMVRFMQNHLIPLAEASGQ
jgi:ATP-binding cassette subfamily C protein